jgi:hypothetical protein
MLKFSPREAIARALPSYGRQLYDLQKADRLIAWLDECGYQIVEKDQVSVVPPNPADTERRQEPASSPK